MANEDQIMKLAVIAGQGPSALKDYERNAQAIGSQRDAALQQAAARAGFVNAPAAFQAAQARRISAPLDALQQQTLTEGQAREAERGGLEAANRGYLGKVGHAQGLAQNILNRKAQEYFQNLNEQGMSSAKSAIKEALAEQRQAAADARREIEQAREDFRWDRYLTTEGREEEKYTKSQAEDLRKSQIESTKQQVFDVFKNSQFRDLSDTLTPMILSGKSYGNVIKDIDNPDSDSYISPETYTALGVSKETLRDLLLRAIDPEAFNKQQGYQEYGRGSRGGL